MAKSELALKCNTVFANFSLRWLLQYFSLSHRHLRKIEGFSLGLIFFFSHTSVAFFATLKAFIQGEVNIRMWKRIIYLFCQPV